MQPVSIFTLAQNDVAPVTPVAPAGPAASGTTGGASSTGTNGATGATGTQTQTGTNNTTGTNTGTGKPPGGGFGEAFPFIMLLVAFAFLFIFQARTSKKEKKKREELFSGLKKGDKVQTIGGILGTIVEVRDLDVVVKVDDNTRIKFVKSAIATVVSDDIETKAEIK